MCVCEYATRNTCEARWTKNKCEYQPQNFDICLHSIILQGK